MEVLHTKQLSAAQRAARAKAVQRVIASTGGHHGVAAASLVLATIDDYGQMQDAGSDEGPVTLFVKNKRIWAVQLEPSDVPDQAELLGEPLGFSVQPPACTTHRASALYLLDEKSFGNLRTESLTRFE